MSSLWALGHPPPGTTNFFLEVCSSIVSILNNCWLSQLMSEMIISDELRLMHAINITLVLKLGERQHTIFLIRHSVMGTHMKAFNFLVHEWYCPLTHHKCLFHPLWTLIILSLSLKNIFSFWTCCWWFATSNIFHPHVEPSHLCKA